jgi:hypothetical protein
MQPVVISSLRLGIADCSYSIWTKKLLQTIFDMLETICPIDLKCSQL